MQNRKFITSIVLSLVVIGLFIMSGCKDESGQQAAETTENTTEQAAETLTTSKPIEDFTMDSKNPLVQFYRESEKALLPLKLDSLMNVYSFILTANNYIKIIDGDTLHNRFVWMNQKNELYFPVYGSVKECPYDIQAFYNLVEVYLTKMEGLPKSSPLYRILDNYKKIKSDQPLSPEVVTGFFVQSFDRNMWGDRTYRNVGYLFYIMLTTLDLNRK